MNKQGKTLNLYKGNWKSIIDGKTVSLIIDDSKGVIKSEKDGITDDEFDSESYVGGPAMLFF